MAETIASLARPRHAILFETATGEITEVPMPGRILVIETGRSHRLTGGELNARRSECEAAAGALGVSSLRDVQQLADIELETLAARYARHTRMAEVCARWVDRAEAGALQDASRIDRKMRIYFAPNHR